MRPAPILRPSFRDRALRIGAIGLLVGILVTCSEPTATNAPGTATGLAFSTQPTSATAGQAMSTVVVTAKDDHNRTAVSFSGNVTLSITAGTGTAGATLAGTLTVAAVQGVATFTDLHINRSGTGYTLSASATGLSLIAPSTAFTINAGPAATLLFTTQPVATAAGSAITPAVVVTAQDVNGNTATSFTGAVAIAIGTNPASGTLTGTASVNAVAGVATFSTLKIDKVGAGYTLKATSLGLTEDISASFSINPGVATTLVFTAQPSNAVAGVALAPAIQVTALDGQGNVATGFAGNVALFFATNPGGGTISGGSAIAASGVANFPAVSVNKSGTGYSFSASSGALATSAPSTTFNITPAAASKLAFTVQASNVVAGAVMAPTVVVQVQDAFGNLVSSTASVALTIGTNPGNSTLGGTTTQSAVAGVASFAGLTLNKTGTGYSLTAASSGLTSAIGSAFNVTPGAPSMLAFGVNTPASVTAGATIAPALTVQILDANANLTASTATVTMTIGNNPGTATLGGTVSVPAVAGVATFSTLTLNKVGTGYTLLAGSASLTGATSGAFNVTPALATKLVFTGQPVSAVAGVIISGITVSAQDPFGNVDPTFAGSVTLGFANNAGGGALGGTVIKAATSGVVSYTDIVINKAAAGYTLQATSGSLTQGTSSGFSITPATAVQLAFTAQPAVLAVAGALLNPAGVQVSVQDQFGNLQPSFSGSVTVAILSGPGALFTSASPGASSVASATATITTGVATFSTLNIHLAGTGYKLSANATGLTAGSSILFDVKAAPATTLSYDQQPSNAVAGLAISPAIKVSAHDPYGNIDLGFVGTGGNLSLAVASGPAGTLVNNSAALSNGVATFTTFNITTAGLGRTLNASGGGLTVASSSFNITAAPATHLVFSAQPGNAVAGVTVTGTSGAVQVTALDQFSNTDLSYTTPIVLSAASGGTPVLGGASVAPTAGVATFNSFNVQTTGTYTLQAASGTLSAPAPVSSSFTVTPAADDHLNITVQPTNVVAGAVISPMTVQILDAFNNLTTSTATITVAIGNNPGSATLGGTKSVAAVAGVATFSTLTLDKTGNGYTLAASATSLGGATSTTFNVTHATATKLVFTSQPATTVAGVVIGGPITVSAQDQFGNLDPTFTSSVTLAFANNPGGGGLGGTLIKAASGGQVTFSDIVITKAASGYTLQASSGALTQGTSSAFTINPAAAAQLAFTSQPPVLAVAGVALNVAVSVQDQFGNLQPSFTGDVTITKNSGPGGLYIDPSNAASTVPSVTVTISSGGVATFSTLNLHTAGTGYKLDANSTGLTGGSSILFNLKAAPATSLVYTQQPTNAVAGVALAPAISLSALDQYLNLDGGFTGAGDNVTLTVASGPAGTLVNAVATPSAGTVTFPTFNVQTAGLARTLHAAGGGLSVNSNAFDITAAPATHLVFTTQPTNQTAGQTIPVVVTAEDQFGNTDLGYGSDVTLAINSGGIASILGTTVTPIAGVATFPGFIVQTAGVWTIKASSGGLLSVPLASNPFTVSPAAANHLVFTASPNPGPTVAGQSIGTVVVTAFDAFNNQDVNYGGNVSLTFANNPAGGTLLGTASHAASAGIATFAGLSVDKTGSGYTLQAGDGSINSIAPSSGFDIIGGAATHLAFTTIPTDVNDGVSFTVTVEAEDGFGNSDPNYSALVNLALVTSPAGSTLNGTVSTNAVAGVATLSPIFSTTSTPLPLGFTIQATSGALPTLTSGTINDN